jgi:hypothetical protein
MVLHVDFKPSISNRRIFLVLGIKWIVFFSLGYIMTWITRDDYQLFIRDPNTRGLWVISLWLVIGILMDVGMHLLKLRFKPFYAKHAPWIYVIFVLLQSVMTFLYFNNIGLHMNPWLGSEFNLLIVILITVFPGLHLELMTQRIEDKYHPINPVINIFERGFILLCFFFGNLFLVSLPLSVRIISTLLPNNKAKFFDHLYQAVLNLLLMVFVLIITILIAGPDVLEMFFRNY